MPIYVRIGMHLLFFGKFKEKVVEFKAIEDLFETETKRQGKYFDSFHSVHNIPKFVKHYKIDLNELLEPDMNKYKTFNEFFYRRLKPNSRLIDSMGDDNIYTSPTDSRAKSFEGGSIAIFRLAPQDYHRFHSPIAGKIIEIKPINGKYYTVNPMAVNEELDVLTENARSLLLLESTSSITPKTKLAFIPVGALLVGSIRYTINKGDVIGKGDELGYFAYGGKRLALPIYVRIGMHLLFFGKFKEKVVEFKAIEDLFETETKRQGKYFDSFHSVHNIPKFVKHYKIDLNELLEPDMNKYKTFNEFFYRRLKPNSRLIDSMGDDNIYTSPTDSRAKSFEGGSIAIFRLAPQDYHRFHSPIARKIIEIKPINGKYYTVNPMAVNEELDVLTENARSLLLLESTSSITPKTKLAFIPVGALLVGSIRYTINKGDVIGKGDELGYFAYGGSTKHWSK
ncbi:8421_t:CDS:2 [Entrophospora sp. SA101]|nr:8421_t:CDS:2 [Entrophospora sp. SA101]